MYWIIPLLLAFLCTLINPYIGLVGILYIGEIVVYWFFDENAEKAADFASGYVEKTDAKYYEVLKKAGKGCLNFWCGLAVLFFVLMTMISVIVETCFKRRKSGKQIRKYTDWDWWDSGCTDIGSRSVRHDE